MLVVEWRMECGVRMPNVAAHAPTFYHLQTLCFVSVVAADLKSNELKDKFLFLLEVQTLRMMFRFRVKKSRGGGELSPNP